LHDLYDNFEGEIFTLKDFCVLIWEYELSKCTIYMIISDKAPSKRTI